VGAEREALLAASKAVVEASSASITALAKSKAVSLGDQKILAAVRVCGWVGGGEPVRGFVRVKGGGLACRCPSVAS
jgi:hypothetical protein